MAGDAIGLVLGIYGAVLSTTLAVLKFRNETPQLSVRADIAQVTITAFFPVGQSGPGWTLRVEGEDDEIGIENPNPGFPRLKVVNTGRTTITLGRVGGGYFDGKEFTATYDPVPMPKRLEPGDHFDFAIRPDAITDELSFIGVWTTAGKLWKAPIEDVADLRNQSAYLNRPISN